MDKSALLRKRILLHTLAYSVNQRRKALREWQERQDEYAIEEIRYRRVRRKRVV
jgi:hypothetical protein